MSIKTNFEIPRAIDENDIIKQGQRTAQDLSKNFKAIRKELDEVRNSYSASMGMTKFIDLDFSFTSSTPTYQIITLPHNLGSVPLGWIIIDIYRVGGNYIAPGVMRVSWDATNITLENYVFMQYVARVRVFI